MLECCRGQILTPATSQTSPPACGDYGVDLAGKQEKYIICLMSGILLTGGAHGVDEVTSELYIPSVSCPLQHCQLADVAERQRYGHTQDGFMVCGGVAHEFDCKTFNPTREVFYT